MHAKTAWPGATGIFGLLLLLAQAATAAPPAAYQKIFFQRGVNFTAEWPDSYSSEHSCQMIDRLAEQGVNAIALVPYGVARSDQPVVRIGGEKSMERDSDIARLTAYAHQRGLKVLLKPQVWGGRANPGDLEFPEARDRAEWFAQYRLFVEHYARLAAAIHADLLAVGVEFVKLSPHEKEWRTLIARARELYPGPLVYAATQGPEFESVTFWDALDYIGLNNYYPLPDDLSTGAVVAKVEAVAKRYRRPVIFPEAGFPSVEGAHREPWSEPRREPAPDHQARCYEALLRAFYHRPWFQGMYWWKVGSNGRGGPRDASLTPWGKPAMEIVRRWYRSGGR